MDTREGQQVPGECIDVAAFLFESMYACPSLQNTELLALWLGEDPRHIRALDIALTEWGLRTAGYQGGTRT